MPVTVTHLPSGPTAGAVRVGSTVSGKTFSEMVLLANYLNGHGTQVIPNHSPNIRINNGNDRTMHYRIKRVYASTRTIWTLQIRSTSTSSAAVAQVSVNGGTAVDYTVSGAGSSYVAIEHQELITRSESEAEITLKIKASVGSIVVQSIGAYDLPRTVLEENSAGDYGIEINTVTPRQPIFENGIRSIEGLADATSSLITRARRTSAFQYALPDDSTIASPETGPLKFSSVGPTNCFLVHPPFLGRKLYNTDTLRTLSCRIYASTDAGTSASFDIATTNGATGTITLGVASAIGWYPSTAGAAATFDVDCEDLSTAHGLRSTRWDDVTFSVTRTAGAGNIYIYSISVWEA